VEVRCCHPLGSDHNSDTFSLGGSLNNSSEGLFSAQMRQFAAPLKVSTSSKSDGASAGNTPTPAPLGPAKVDDITSPHELTAFVRCAFPSPVSRIAL